MSVGPEQRIAVDPRREFRARQKALADGDPALGDRALGAPPPSLLGGPGPPSTGRLPRPLPLAQADPYMAALRLQVRPGQHRMPQARVRVYHRVDPSPGLDGLCWAFTLSRTGWERLLTERVLDSEGATYPDGRACVPNDANAFDVSVRCGTCGTQTVECLEMEFFEDS